MIRSKYKNVLMLLFMVCLAWIPGNELAAQARQGVLVLEEEQLREEKPVRLYGQWAFFWRSFVSPSFPSDSLQPDLFGEVPAYWTSYKDQIPGITGMGYASYRLQLILPHNHPGEISFSIPVFDASYTMFINGKKVAANGQPGTTPEETRPEYQPLVHDYKVTNDTLIITLHVANFHHRRGGFWKPMEVGLPGVVHNKQERKKVYTYSTIGILLAFFLFFLFFRIISRKEKVMLLFALTIFGIFLRSVSTGLYIGNAFIVPHWSWTVKLEYLGTYMAFLFGVLYLHAFFPTRKLKPFIQANTYLLIFLMGVVVFTPVRIFSYTILIFQLLALIFMIFFLVRSALGVLKNNTVHILFFISLLLFLATLVNDILISASYTSLTMEYLSHITFQAFILLQSIVLIRRWNNHYQERIRLSQELSAINENLEHLVQDRTRELETSLELKNKLFSIIGHDLKSPVSNLAQYSELLLQNQKLDEDEIEMIRELNKMSYASVDLIDNLIYWGRQQVKQISYNPAVVDLSIHARSALQFHQQSAAWKNITLEKHIPDNVQARCDAILLDIILRNLVSNGIKFTEKGGKVTLALSEAGDRILVSVTDTGIGIRKEKIDALLNHDHVESTPGTEQEKGTGLGLVLVKELVKINQGEFQISSEPGKGTTVWFDLEKA